MKTDSRNCRRAGTRATSPSQNTTTTTRPRIQVWLLMGVLTQLTIAASAQNYQYWLIEYSGHDNITSFGDRPSVNIHGDVAFVQRYNGVEDVFVGDGRSPAQNVSGYAQANRIFGRAVQINNQNQIVAYDRAVGNPPLTFIHRWDRTLGIWFRTTIGRGGNASGYEYSLVYDNPSMNNLGDCVFNASPLGDLTKSVLATSPTTSSPPFPSVLFLRPMLSDNPNQISYRAGNTTSDPIQRRSFDFTTTTPIAGATFTKLGRSPGISDDGHVVAFSAEDASGPGIFIWGDYVNGSPVRVAGLRSLAGDPSVGDLGKDGSGTPIFFSAVDLENRVAVQAQPYTIEGKTCYAVVLCFVATPSAAGNAVKVGTQELTFSGSEGIWVIQGVLIEDSTRPGFFKFRRLAVFPVVQKGQMIAASDMLWTIDAYSLYDPLSVKAGGSRPSGQMLFSHYVAFWAKSGNTELILRANGPPINIVPRGDPVIYMNAQDGRTLQIPLQAEIDDLLLEDVDWSLSFNYASAVRDLPAKMKQMNITTNRRYRHSECVDQTLLLMTNGVGGGLTIGASVVSGGTRYSAVAVTNQIVGYENAPAAAIKDTLVAAFGPLAVGVAEQESKYSSVHITQPEPHLTRPHDGENKGQFLPRRGGCVHYGNGDNDPACDPANAQAVGLMQINPVAWNDADHRFNVPALYWDWMTNALFGAQLLREHMVTARDYMNAALNGPGNQGRRWSRALEPLPDELLEAWGIGVYRGCGDSRRLFRAVIPPDVAGADAHWQRRENICEMIAYVRNVRTFAYDLTGDTAVRGSEAFWQAWGTGRYPPAPPPMPGPRQARSPLAVIQLETVTALFDEVQLTISISFSNRIAPASQEAPESLGGYIDLDVDQDERTGSLVLSEMFGDQQAPTLGTDFYLDLFSEGSHPGFVDLVDNAAYSTVGSVPILYGSSNVVITIPSSALGGALAVRLSLVVGTLDFPTDNVRGSEALSAVPSDQYPFVIRLISVDPFDGRRLLVVCPGCGQCTIQKSQDLVSWTSVFTNNVQNGTLLYHDIGDGAEESAFYRALRP